MHRPQQKCYDTAVKHLYRLGCEAMIPASLQAAIPRSNIHRWKQEPSDKYQGFELRNVSAERLELLQQFASHQAAQRAFRSLVRLLLVIQRTVFAVKGVRDALRKSGDAIIQQAEQARQGIGIKPILKLLAISRGTYDHWKARAIHRCAGSPLALCLRRHPQQLTGGEVAKMRSMLQAPEHLHWPISSLAAFARRGNILPLSDNTWYRYASLLGLRRKPHRPEVSRESIRATQPDEYWHGDVTEIKTIDGVKHYLYLVIDNFSRKVLSWALSTRLMASIRMETLREAFQKSSKTIETTLVVDGGTENHNQTVQAFLATPDVAIKMITAQVDVSFSNSIVEAVNKILKSRYIRLKAPPDGIALQKVLEWAINDYNSIRPHTSLHGLTPTEAYSGIGPESLHMPEKVKAACRARIQANKRNSCKAGC
jgi:putative transposase